jgi:hypothetical protein
VRSIAFAHDDRSSDAAASRNRPATKQFDGTRIRNHAKFLAIVHRSLLVTSANFSWSAEHGKVEFRVVLIDNRTSPRPSNTS